MGGHDIVSGIGKGTAMTIPVGVVGSMAEVMPAAIQAGTLILVAVQVVYWACRIVRFFCEEKKK